MSPEQFLQVADVLPEPTLLVGGDGLIHAANRAAEGRLGLPRAGLAGRRLADLAADPADKVADYLRACSRTRSPVLGSLAVRGQGGGPTRCRCDGAAVRPDPDPAATRVLLRLTPAASTDSRFAALNQKIEELNREVRRRRRAEEELRRERELLQVTLTSVGDALVTTDTAGRVTFLNRVAERLTGWATADAAGRPLAEVFPIYNERTGEPVESPVASVLRDGRVVALANHTVLRARGGAERPIADSAAPIRDDAGRLSGVVLVFRDVSAERDAEAALRRSERRFRTLADSIPQLAWAARPDGHIEWYNRRWYEYTGTTPEQMEGWGWQSVHDLAELPKVLERWRESIATGEPFDMVFPIRGRDGVFRPFLTRVVPLKDDGGRVLQWFGTNTDVSEIRAMQARLEEADRRKDEWVMMLAHELRNPLAPIRNSLQVLESPGADRGTVDQARRVMARQVGHLARIVDDLLDVSRLVRGRVDLRPERLDLGQLARTVLEDQRPVLDAAGVSAGADLPELPVWVNGDPTRLTQVLDNLLQNAAKFTGRGGSVAVRVEADAGRREAVLCVRDTGVGIEPALLPRLFEAFAQADQGLARSRGGLGLGLAVVRGLVDLHGGTVEARSDGPGRGAEFVVRLPLQPEPAAVTAIPADPARTPGRLRVLVVEDNRDAADSLRMLLEAYGHTVRVAYTGPAGVDAAVGWSPDAVVCDIGLPGLDGYGVVRELRRHPATEAARVIAVTGYGGEEDRLKAREAGFDAHLTKPADPAALQELLTRSGRDG